MQDFSVVGTWIPHRKASIHSFLAENRDFRELSSRFLLSRRQESMSSERFSEK
jgi:hypothetical protein